MTDTETTHGEPAITAAVDGIETRNPSSDVFEAHFGDRKVEEDPPQLDEPGAEDSEETADDQGNDDAEFDLEDDQFDEDETAEEELAGDSLDLKALGFESTQHLLDAAVATQQENGQLRAMLQQIQAQGKKPGNAPSPQASGGDIPYADDPRVNRAVRAAFNGDTESLKKLPQEIQSKAAEQAEALTERNIQLLRDPVKFLSKHLGGNVAGRLRELEQAFNSMWSQRLLTQSGLTEPRDVQAMQKYMADGIPQHKAAEFVLKDKRLAELEKREQGVRSRQKDQDAAEKSRRGSQRRTRGRRGGKKAEKVFGAEYAKNPFAIAQHIMKENNKDG